MCERILMIADSRYLFLFAILIQASCIASAQTDNPDTFVPPLNRQLFHGYVDAEQRSLLKYDGKADNQLIISSNEEISSERLAIKRV